MKQKVQNKIHVNKFVILFGLFLFAIIIARLVYLNLSPKIDGINLSKFAKNRNTVKRTLNANRGTIYDSNEEVLAETVDSYTVVAFLDKSRSKNSTKPKHVVDVEETAKALSPLINMSEERLIELMSQKGLYQVELGPGGKGLTELQKEEIEKLELPGIGFIPTQKRYYPNLDFASYVIGYVREYDDGKTVGEMGIEAKFNSELTGVNGSVTYQQDANGYKLINSPEIRIEKEDGYDIYLTIDSNVQLMTERALNDAFSRSGASKAIFIVAEAKTGKIIASATKPSFDPNVKNITNYLDPLVSYSYEPGSTMKTFTYMATIEKGNYNGQDTYHSGTMKIDEYTIKDWNTYGWGDISYDYGYAQSSNLGVANLTQKYLTGQELKDYLKKLGFGSKTGIELPGEVSGKVDFTYKIEVATASFGQGITITPVQMIKALTAISNDGYVLNPTIVEKIVSPDTGEIIYQNKPQKGTKVASQETVNKIKSLMNDVVTIGTGTSYNMDGYDIIGKTGTAEVYNANTGRYYKTTYRNIRSFAGMYPKDNPKYVMYIAFENAASSSQMADAVKSLIQDIEAYYNLTNVRATTNYAYKVGNYSNKKVVDVKTELDNNGISYELIGDGDIIIDQYPTKDNYVDGKILLKTNGNIGDTDLRGFSSKSLRNYCRLINAECNLNGSGYVTDHNFEKDGTGKIIKVNAELYLPSAE
ncbi:MAG: hypothetical protein IKE10_00280 [Bacilli bacterium]|nr:hypothetical protein [Bacilli bacterium]